MGAIKASSLRIDLSIGKHDSGFTQLMQPSRNGSQTPDVINFDMIDKLAMGLQSHKVLATVFMIYSTQKSCKISHILDIIRKARHIFKVVHIIASARYSKTNDCRYCDEVIQLPLLDQ